MLVQRRNSQPIPHQPSCAHCRGLRKDDISRPTEIIPFGTGHRLEYTLISLEEVATRRSCDQPRPPFERMHRPISFLDNAFSPVPLHEIGERLKGRRHIEVDEMVIRVSRLFSGGRGHLTIDARVGICSTIRDTRNNARGEILSHDYENGSRRASGP